MHQTEAMPDFDPDPAGLHQAVDMLLDALAEPGSPHSLPDVNLGAWADTGLGGRDALQALSRAALTEVSRLDHPGFFAHMDPPTPWMTWATAMWSAAMNQNLLHTDSGPAARQVERQVVDWLAPAFGMRGGHIVPGSTMANLTALWAARDVAGVRKVVCSTAAHVSIAKAAALLGLELVSVPTDDAERLRLDLLPDDLRDAALVLIAGTVASGAVDPLDGVEAGWVHVDAAWAGPLRLSSHDALLNGAEQADSVGFSAHKWLFQPKESALVLFADPDIAHAAMTYGGSYLAVPNVGLLGSHGGSAGLALAASLLAWGRDGVRDLLDSQMTLADDLADAVLQAGLELWRPPVTGVVNWRVPGVACEDVQKRLDGAWVSSAIIDGQRWLRSVAANPKADPQAVVNGVLRTTSPPGVHRSRG